MEQIELNMKLRTVKGKQVSSLRRAGDVPAVLYSRRGDPVVVQANTKELLRVLTRAGGSRLVKLNIEGAPESAHGTGARSAARADQGHAAARGLLRGLDVREDQGGNPDSL